MVASPENFQLICIGLKEDIKLCINTNGIVVQINDSRKLYGVKIDSDKKRDDNNSPQISSL